MQSETRGHESKVYSQLLFPGVSGHFIGAVISMMPVMGIAWLNIVDLALPGQETPLKAITTMIGVLASAFLLAHPTFMLAKGRQWPHRFLRGLNITCLGILVAAAATHLIKGQLELFWFDLAGLIFASIAFKLYRSQRFARFCDHYQLLSELYPKNGRTD